MESQVKTLGRYEGQREGSARVRKPVNCRVRDEDDREAMWVIFPYRSLITHADDESKSHHPYSINRRSQGTEYQIIVNGGIPQQFPCYLLFLYLVLD